MLHYVTAYDMREGAAEDEVKSVDESVLYPLGLGDYIHYFYA